MSKKTKKLDPLFQRKEVKSDIVNVSARLPKEIIEKFNDLNDQLADQGLHIPLKSVIENGLQNAIALQEKALKDAEASDKAEQPDEAEQPAEQPDESVLDDTHEELHDSDEEADD